MSDGMRGAGRFLSDEDIAVRVANEKLQAEVARLQKALDGAFHAIQRIALADDDDRHQQAIAARQDILDASAEIFGVDAAGNGGTSGPTAAGQQDGDPGLREVIAEDIAIACYGRPSVAAAEREAFLPHAHRILALVRGAIASVPDRLHAAPGWSERDAEWWGNGLIDATNSILAVLSNNFPDTGKMIPKAASDLRELIVEVVHWSSGYTLSNGKCEDSADRILALLAERGPVMPEEPSLDAKLAVGRVFVTVFGGGEDRQAESGRGYLTHECCGRVIDAIRAALAKDRRR